MFIVKSADKMMVSGTLKKKKIPIQQGLETQSRGVKVYGILHRRKNKSFAIGKKYPSHHLVVQEPRHELKQGLEKHACK